MAIPPVPTQFYVQQGNQQVYLSWNAVPNVITNPISYVIQRSTDNLNFTPIATVTTPYYTDATALLGVPYYYTVAASNTSGTGPATNSQVTVVTPGGEMSLAELRLRCQQRADRVNSNFVTAPEWNSYINQSMYELYDILVGVYEDYYVAPFALFYSNNNTGVYPLPDGSASFINESGQSYVAPALYKLLGVDLGLNTSNNGFATVNKFNLIDRNKYFYPNTASTIYGVFNLQYRVEGSNIRFIPVPSANQPIRLIYVPKLKQLLADTDTTTTSISGWLEYVITDAAIKALQKEEADVSVLGAQKAALVKRIQSIAANRDAGRPDTISDVRSNRNWGDGQGGGWFQGGY